jgi:hypothetical protein
MLEKLVTRGWVNTVNSRKTELAQTYCTMDSEKSFGYYAVSNQTRHADSRFLTSFQEFPTGRI